MEEYTNNCNCIQVSRRESYLDKNRHLSEFISSLDKEKARLNLGIPEIIQKLIQKIDAKVIQQGGVNWDTTPTKNNFDKVLSSDALYETFQNYVSKNESEQIQENIFNQMLEFKNYINSKLEFLELLITSFLESEHQEGLALSNSFGDSKYIGINQKSLTAAFNKLWSKIEDITGETLQGFNMVVTPEYYIGETGADVHITASTVNINGIFEHIAFYGNGVLITEANNVDFFEYDFHIDETTVVKCVAKIMGIEYNRQSVITHYSSFWLGCGLTYTDVMNPEHIIPITHHMRSAYDVTAKAGDHIIIIIGEGLAKRFIRADMNGIEIQFVENTITIDDNTYKVFVSENTYQTGTYNIDING